MDPVLAVRRLTLGSGELIRRIRHVAVGRSLIGLTSPPATQRFVGVVEPAAHLSEALVSSGVEPSVGLCSPQLVFLGDQLLDPI